MRVSSAPLALVGAVLPFVLADIQITSPKAGDAWKGAQTVSVEWKDSGSGPSLDQFTSYNMFLCMGSNADPQCNVALGPADSKFSAATTSAKVQIPAAAGADGKNVYFVKIQGVTPKGNTINYSERFSLSGMSGTFTPTQLADQKVGDKSPPPSQNLIAQVADAAGDEISVTYTMQTGETRYAPMQTQPGTTITAKSASRPYPSSSYSVFKSGQWPQPNVQTTITAAWTYTRTSLVNTASAAPQPTDLQKYLNRWKD